MREFKNIKAETEKEILTKIICDECGKELTSGSYLSYCQSDGRYPESGFKCYQFCSIQCITNNMSKMTLNEFDLVFTVDVYNFRSD
ncbi:MAG: hypothetical protein ACOCVF_04110 [bacterium]